MQAVRLLARPGASCITKLSFCYKGLLHSRIQTKPCYEGTRLYNVKYKTHQPFFSSLVSPLPRPDSCLALSNRIQLICNKQGKHFGPRGIYTVVTGGILASGLIGLPKVSCMEQNEDVNTKSSVTDVAKELEDQRYRRLNIIPKLWIPSLCILTIAIGWHYPLSLFFNVIFLMWSTKPNPASIYKWVEEKRQQEAWEKRGLDRLTAQTSGVMHVEVRDHKLFCLARVTTLTKRTITLGALGNWWTIYSSTSAIHTGMNVKNLVKTVTPFVKEQFSIN